MVSIIIAGDFLPAECNKEDFTTGKLDKLFDKAVIDLFHDSDYSICNLEGAISDIGQPIRKSGPHIKADKSTICAIKRMGVCAFALANNRIMDYGKEAFDETCRILDNSNIEWFGAGESLATIRKYLVIEKDGKKIAFYNVAETEFNIPDIDGPGVNLFNDFSTYDDVRKLKEICDYIIVIYHGGTEKFRYPSPKLRQRFTNLVKCGADVVTAQHSHCVGTFEKIGTSYLVYGQGNFQFARSLNEYTSTSVLLQLFIDKDIRCVFHHLKRVGGKTIYEGVGEEYYSDMNFKLHNGDYEKVYTNYALELLPTYLEAFQGQSLYNRVLRKILPRHLYNKHLIKLYRNSDIPQILNSIRCETHRELLIEGLKSQYDVK